MVPAPIRRRGESEHSNGVTSPWASMCFTEEKRAELVKARREALAGMAGVRVIEDARACWTATGRRSRQSGGSWERRSARGIGNKSRHFRNQRGEGAAKSERFRNAAGDIVAEGCVDRLLTLSMRFRANPCVSLRDAFFQ